MGGALSKEWTSSHLVCRQVSARTYGDPSFARRFSAYYLLDLLAVLIAIRPNLQTGVVMVG